jgi:GH25 family lysozyme M1 (1,4-beta-N-acetylmuramidase)
MTILGVDVASFQGTIDWPKVAASGIRFGIARCVREAELGVDAYYARNVAGARAAGITPGAYAFLSGGGYAAKQAALFIATVGDPTGMLIALDVEKGALTPTAADVRTFAAAWYAVHPDHTLLIYGSRGSTLGGLGTLAGLGPLWLAAYPRTDHASPADLYTLSGGAKSGNWASMFGGWTHPDIWQFASSGVVPGISGSVDVDAIEAADLAALTGEAADMATTTITLFPKGPQTASVGPGTIQGYWWNASTGTMTDASKQAFAAASGFLADAYVAISGRGTFVRAINGAFKDQLLSGGAVKFPNGDPLALPVPTAPDTSPFTQADIDKAVAADRLKAHVTWQ